MVGNRAVRAAAKLWYVKMLSDQQTVPVPRDSAEVLSGASDPDRVLLIGNGPTHGWGTVTHELALTGQLSRSLTRRTGRPTDTLYIGDETMNLASTIPWLGDQPLAGFDLVLLVLSMNDAVRMTPVEEYRFDMERLLTKLALETKPSARIIVAGIHSVSSLPHYRGVLAKVGQRSADRLNAVTRELIGRFDGMEFMQLDVPDTEPGRPFGSPQMYADWSELFADVCGPALDEARLLGDERVVLPRAERRWDWEPGSRILETAQRNGLPELERLVAEAKQDLGVDVAYVSLIDGGRQYFAATTAPVGREVPLDLSICRVTVEGDETVVIENSLKDERFRHSPFIDLTQVRSYVGAPLKNEQGENIGTFCLQSVLPGQGGKVSEQRFHAFAERAQVELQRLAADRAGQDEAARGAAPEDHTVA